MPLRRPIKNNKAGLFHTQRRHTHTVKMSVADAAVHRTRSSICPSQWGSGGPPRPANQSLSPPVLQRSSRLHRAECRAQSTVPIIAISAEPRWIPAHHLSSWEVKRKRDKSREWVWGNIFRRSAQTGRLFQTFLKRICRNRVLKERSVESLWVPSQTSNPYQQP